MASPCAAHGPLPDDPIELARRQLGPARLERGRRRHGPGDLDHACAAGLPGADRGDPAPFGLTFARYEVLRLLAFSRRGVMPVGKIGERLQVHPASVTNAVQRLEADGLVRRTDNPNDGRSVLAEITDSGRRLVEECTDRLNAEVFAAVPIPLGQQERAFKALKGVRKAFGDFT